jgi:hypothetical protein
MVVLVVTPLCQDKTLHSVQLETHQVLLREQEPDHLQHFQR